MHRVAAAGMRDGSVTLPPGTAGVVKGARCRFFVRDAGYARRELDALWRGYEKRSAERAVPNDGGGEGILRADGMHALYHHGEREVGGENIHVLGRRALPPPPSRVCPCSARVFVAYASPPPLILIIYFAPPISQ